MTISWGSLKAVGFAAVAEGGTRWVWWGILQDGEVHCCQRNQILTMLPFALAFSFAAAIQDEPGPAAVNSTALGEMLHNLGTVAFVVLVVLLLLSIFSWMIMLSKWMSFGAARKQSARFLRAFRRSGKLSEIAALSDQFRPSPLVPVFTERAAATASSEALTVMEKRLTWLATIATNAPYIGLFGTVMGIVDAFHGLGTAGAATLRAVAPGISEALITTAAGLLVAVPAVIAYNQFTARLRDFGARMDDFGRELLNSMEESAVRPAEGIGREVGRGVHN